MSTPTALVTLAEVKAYLNITNADDDTELLGFIDAATIKIQEITGPVLARTVTEYRDGGTSSLILTQRPVISVTSVTELIGSTQTVLTQNAYGAGTTDYGFTFDSDACTVTRRMGNDAATFADGVGNIKIVYSAGYAAIPAEIGLASKALIQHWWSSSQLNRNGGRPTLGGMDYSPAVGGGYAIPNFVREMLPQRDNVSWLA